MTSARSTFACLLLAVAATNAAGSCACEEIPFLSRRKARFNDFTTIAGSAGTNDVNGRVRVGQGVFMSDGTSLYGDVVDIKTGANLAHVFATTTVRIQPGAVIRDGIDPIVLPAVEPFCTVPTFFCGTQLVTIHPAQTSDPLPPGVYGTVRVLKAATLRLAGGDYAFCDVKMSRDARIEAEGSVVMNVSGNMQIGRGSYFGPTGGAPGIVAVVAGKRVKVGRSAVTNAEFTAPLAKVSFGTGARFDGCYCATEAKVDRQVALTCPASP
jgi:hypothetical protein